MKKWKIAAALFAAFVAGNLFNSTAASAAYGFCMAPRAPSAFLTKPIKPYCAASRSCSEWQVRSYRNEVDSYFRNLRAFAEDVDEYYSDATDYVACMSKLD